MRQVLIVLRDALAPLCYVAVHRIAKNAIQVPTNTKALSNKITPASSFLYYCKNIMINKRYYVMVIHCKKEIL